MNIFHLDNNPMLAARYYNDTHCRKICLELGQMVSTAFRKRVPNLAFSDNILNEKGKRALYKSSYANHPMTLWVGESDANFRWTMTHWKYLLFEFKYRGFKGSGDDGNHASHHVYDFVEKNFNLLDFENSHFTSPPQCFGEFSFLRKSKDRYVDGYRHYYVVGKTFDKNGNNIDNWTKRGRPSWWSEYESCD